MNRDEAKEILICYRHGTADAADPQVAEALAVAKADAELAGWLEMHCARQFVLSEKLRQIVPPAGLKEQIISEHAAQQKATPFLQRELKPLPLLVGALVVLLVTGLCYKIFFRDDTLQLYRLQMASTANHGYDMTLATNDLQQIRNYLAENKAPADFELPPSLKKISLTGCTVTQWHEAKVALVCFRTSAASTGNNLWLFVVDQSAVSHLPWSKKTTLANIEGIATASWTRGGKLYLLGTLGDERELQLLL